MTNSEKDRILVLEERSHTVATKVASLEVEIGYVKKQGIETHKLVQELHSEVVKTKGKAKGFMFALTRSTAFVMFIYVSAKAYFDLAAYLTKGLK